MREKPHHHPHPLPLNHQNHRHNPERDRAPSSDPRLDNYEALLRLAELLGDSKGMANDAIQRLPSYLCDVSTLSPDMKWCVVCMCDFEQHELLRILPYCNHEFHAKCVDKWLRGNKTCPICRTNVDIKSGSSPPSASAAAAAAFPASQYYPYHYDHDHHYHHY